MAASDWNPALYSRFEQERTRPAADLLARVPLDAAARVMDLGCGPGNSTELLAKRYPQAQLSGLDSSPQMLQAARQRLPQARFESGDIAAWSATLRFDLLFANASLQWVPDHERLLPRLLAALRAGGVLAVQVPDNRNEPTHELMRELAAQPPFAGLIDRDATRRVRIEAPERYYDLLAPLAEVDLWRTVYYHPMADAAAIVAWVSATGLRPFLERLADDRRGEFLAEYQRRVEAAYPARADGARLLRFPRLFLLARRRDGG